MFEYISDWEYIEPRPSGPMAHTLATNEAISDWEDSHLDHPLVRERVTAFEAYLRAEATLQSHLSQVVIQEVTV
jgi:hypothetical protein